MTDTAKNNTGDYSTNLTEIECLKAIKADLVDVAHRWAMAMWQSGISPVENSMNPLESLVFDTQAALFRATGRDVVADSLEKITAGNRKAGQQP